LIQHFEKVFFSEKKVNLSHPKRRRTTTTTTETTTTTLKEIALLSPLNEQQ